MGTNTLGKLYTISEAAELLHCHPNTLRHWEKQGLIKAIRFGPRRDRRYTEAELQRIIRHDQ